MSAVRRSALWWECYVPPSDAVSPLPIQLVVKEGTEGVHPHNLLLFAGGPLTLLLVLLLLVLLLPVATVARITGSTIVFVFWQKRHDCPHPHEYTHVSVVAAAINGAVGQLKVPTHARGGWEPRAAAAAALRQ